MERVRKKVERVLVGDSGESTSGGDSGESTSGG